MADLLKKWEPFRELSTIQREMDDFFKRVFGSLSPTGVFRREIRGEWFPTMDVYTRENQMVVHCDLPGVNPKDVDISITGNVLTVRGERKADWEEKKGGYLVREASYGGFERAITLPEGVDTANIRATFKNGVLELTMPAKAEALPKKVKIEIEEKKAA